MSLVNSIVAVFVGSLVRVADNSLIGTVLYLKTVQSQHFLVGFVQFQFLYSLPYFSFFVKLNFSKGLVTLPIPSILT